MPSPAHILFVFIDGIGIPAEPLGESCYAGCPALRQLISEHSAPLDACLGVPGTPQSATGQTAIFTGVNAARVLGRHLEGFPNAALRRIIESESLFRRLVDAGRSCTFANAYASQPGDRLPGIFRSVTTVMTLSALGGTRNRDALLRGEAVYHDITRRSLPERGVSGIPPIDESEAAAHLLQIMRSVDLTVFEFFLTDHAGHRGNLERQLQVLESLDLFLTGLMAGLDRERELLLLVSDHGNIECAAQRGHSQNPVPFAAYGTQSHAAVEGCQSLLDVTPRVLQIMGVEDKRAAVTAAVGSVCEQ